jgi:hypothetical protein
VEKSASWQGSVGRQSCQAHTCKPAAALLHLHATLQQRAAHTRDHRAGGKHCGGCSGALVTTGALQRCMDSDEPASLATLLPPSAFFAACSCRRAALFEPGRKRSISLTILPILLISRLQMPRAQPSHFLQGPCKNRSALNCPSANETVTCSAVSSLRCCAAFMISMQHSSIIF